MKYKETLDFLYGQLPMYQRVGAAAYKDNLDNTIALDEMFGKKHKEFKSIHVAGTNGKGSVSHQLASVLQSSGYKVGLYTSPHLKDYRERIRVDGEMVSEEFVVDFVERFNALNEGPQVQPSFFELSVIMAFDYFASQKVDIAVIEVGLGGRLDSTNVIEPEVSVITNISLDHTNLLGDSVAEIAAEKAGIIKNNIPVVIGEKQKETTSVFKQKAFDVGTSLVFADSVYSVSKNEKGFYIESESFIMELEEPSLKGNYQQKNLPTIFATIEVLKKRGWEIDDVCLKHGLQQTVTQTGLQGRWQTINDNPRTICDTGHNEAGIHWVTSQLEEEPYENLHIVFGTVNDKNINKVLQLLPQKAKYYFAKANIDRALDVNNLYEQAVKCQLKGERYASVSDAIKAAQQNAGPNDLVFVGGSTFVVAEVL